MDQVFRDQHFQSQGYFEEVAHETIRNLRLVATPIKREGGWREGADRAPPVLAQHSTEILREAGFSDAEVADLLAKKIVHPFTGEEHVRS
jgi:crotonobetainyl-CoA:carnitine CoA-transferase CaiB-like acyl-CoA transferase